MNKQYETVFIMNPVLSEQQVKETVKNYAGLIKKLEGKVLFTESWGLRKLAYPIDKKKTGFYHLFEFTAPSIAIETLELEMKRDVSILRTLTTLLDKHSIAYNIKRREKKGTNQTSK